MLQILQRVRYLHDLLYNLVKVVSSHESGLDLKNVRDVSSDPRYLFNISLHLIHLVFQFISLLAVCLPAIEVFSGNIRVTWLQSSRQVCLDSCKLILETVDTSDRAFNDSNSSDKLTFDLLNHLLKLLDHFSGSSVS